MDRDILLTIAFIITFPLLCLIAPLSFITYNYLQILLGKAPSRSKTRHAKTMVVLGSGGHTAEMLALVRALDHQHYTPRIYVAADTDNHSITRALTQEQTLQQAASKSTSKNHQKHNPDNTPPLDVRTYVIPRSREVGQSYITSVGTTLRALLGCWRFVFAENPDLVLVNGPGTCVPICAAALLLRLTHLHDTRIAYVESIARVQSLSLSGKVLYYSRVADVMLVQWPEMAQRYPRCRYVGRLM